MVEHYTKALVLDKEDLGDLDSRVFLYCQGLGKASAKVKSARKITSKLAGHLEPGNFVDVRLIELGGFQAVDALAYEFLPRTAKTVTALRLIRELTADQDFDQELWDLIENREFVTGSILSCLGFSPEFATCRICQQPDPAHFLVRDLEYSCYSCLVKAGRPLHLSI
jgi:recombinational DNA repair protein (RecF pathway)